MKRIFLFFMVPVFSALAVDLGLSSAVQFSDARFGCDVRSLDYMTGQPGMIEVSIPTGEWNALTFTMWARLVSTSSTDNLFFNMLTTGAFYCPEPIQRSAPDLLGGRCGFPDGTNLASAAAFDLVFSRESGSVPTNVFSRGVYTVAGWASNVVTVILGGNELSLGPGAFNCNVLPGPSDGVVVDGTGLCAVAVSRLHAHQFFSFTDGVHDDSNGLLTPDSIITNEVVFIAFRLDMTSSVHVHRTDMWHFDFANSIGMSCTNSLPDNPAIRAYSSRGMYRIGMRGLSPSSNLRFDVFDYRCFTRRLTDSELLRVYDNGRQEIERRGIPRFRNGY